jgi:predicted permease
VALGIDGIEARSAVLIASLPVALAAFTLGQTYFDGANEGARAGMEVIAVEIIVGSILMPFVFLAWHSILEAGDVFGAIPEGAKFTG